MSVIYARIASHMDDCSHLRDDDAYAAGGWCVVSVAGEAPVSGAARYITERGAKIQEIVQVLTVHASGGTRGTVRVSVIDAGITSDVDDRIRLADGDRDIAARG